MKKKRSVGIMLCGIIMFLFGLFSIFYGLSVLHPIGGLTSDRFADIRDRIAQLLILISGLVYIGSSVIIFSLKKWARKLAIYYSVVLLFYFIPVSIYLFSDPWGWGQLVAILYSPYILFSLLFIITLTRPKVKEQFK